MKTKNYEELKKRRRVGTKCREQGRIIDPSGDRGSHMPEHPKILQKDAATIKKRLN